MKLKRVEKLKYFQSTEKGICRSLDVYLTALAELVGFQKLKDKRAVLPM